MGIEIAAIILLLILSGFFSSTETAFTSLSPIQIEMLAGKKGNSGKLVKKILKKPEKFMTTVLTGNNLVNISLSVISTELTIKIIGNAYIGVMTGILTLIVLIFGEVIPKNFALEQNERIAVFVAPVINVIIVILTPFTFLISQISKLTTKFFKKKPRDPISTDAILRMVKYAESKGILDDYENDMVHAVFRLGQQNISSIMTHRTKVFSLDQESLMKDVMPAISEQGFSRIPVYGKNTEDITGVVLVKDLVKRVTEKHADPGKIKLSDIMITPFFIAENKKIREALFLMQKEKKKMAIVRDEYSGLAGIVTTEDIMEEIVGELYDEGDTNEGEKITKLSENRYLVQGETLITTVNDKLDINLPIGRLSQTTGGFIIDELGKIPKKKDKLVFENVELLINSVSLKKINNIIITVHEEE